MLLVPAVGVHTTEENTTEVWKNDSEFHQSFDTYFLVYESGEKSMMELYNVGDGSAQNTLNAHPIYVTDELAIKVRGWAGLYDGTPFEAYGYRINGGNAVYDADFKLGAEQAVYNAGGDSRYSITIPIAGRKAPTLLTVVVKDVNGVEHDLMEFSVNGNYGGSNSIYVTAEGGRNEKKANCGETVDIAVKVETGAEFKSLKAKISWPEELYLINAVYGPDVQNMTVSTPKNGWESLDGSYEFSCSSPKKKLSGEFTFVTLTFEVNGKVKSAGLLPVTVELDSEQMLSASGEYIAAHAINGGVFARQALTGDVNCDGSLDNKDVVILFRYVSGIRYRIFSESAADVNEDGSLDNKDVVVLFRLVSNPPVIPTEPTEKPEVLGISDLGGTFLIYGATEPDSVIRSVIGGNEAKNKSNGKYFYIEAQCSYGDVMTLYATASGKTESDPLVINVNPTTGGGNVWVGKNSHIFYSGTYGFLVGNEADMSSLNSLKTYITNKTITEIQKATGKKTKLIYAIIPDPATAYYDEHNFSVAAPTKSAMQSFVKEIDGCHEDVYALDLFSVMRAHKDDRIYFSTDTHYTEFGAYYVYLDIMKRVRETHKSAKVRTIENGDYTVEYIDVPGGDMCGMAGMSMNEVVPFFIANFTDTGSYYLSKRADGIKSAGFGPGGWQQNSELQNSSNPTCYFLGDSYGCYILPFIGANFSKVWTNPGVLWSYSLDKNILQQNKPDYVILLVCQRNVGPNFMSNLVKDFSMSVSGF